jgi:hypothetical protein
LKIAILSRASAWNNGAAAIIAFGLAGSGNECHNGTFIALHLALYIVKKICAASRYQ